MPALNQDKAFHADYEEIEDFAQERIRAMLGSAFEHPSTVSELLEAEQNERSFSPNEEWISGLNKREDSDEAWEVFEEALAFAAQREGIPDENVLSAEEAEERFQRMLNEDYYIQVEGVTFAPADVLQQMDPTAYQEEFNNYKDSLHQDGFRVDETK